MPGRSSRSSAPPRSCGCSRAAPAPRRGRARGRAGPAEGHRARHPAHAAHVGFVEQDPESGKYQLGAALLHMGSSYLDGNELRTRALNWSDALAARSSESVRIGTLHEGRVLVVHHVFRPDDSRQTLEVGALLPAHATALGKVLLATNRYAAAGCRARAARASRRATITDPDELREELAEIARARLGGRARGARRRRGLARRADRGPARRRPSARSASRARSSGSATDGAPRTTWSSYVREAARAVSRDLGRSRGEATGGSRVTERYIAAIDQGTTSSRCIVFDAAARVVSVSQQEHQQIYPAARAGSSTTRSEIWRNVSDVVAGRARAARSSRSADLAALGITNQRETTVLWDRETGEPVHNAIVWQDTRTDELVRELGGDGGQDRFRERCGLPLATYFSGPKSAGCSTTSPGLRERAEARRRAVRHDGHLADLEPHAAAHVTDVTNASRTMLMNLETLDWDDELLDAIGVPRAMLPEIRPSAEVYGEAARRARRRAGRRGARRPAGGAVRADLLRRRARPSARTAPAASCCSTPATEPVQSKPRAAHHGRLPDRRRSPRSTRWRARSRSPARSCSGCATTSS